MSPGPGVRHQQHPFSKSIGNSFTLSDSEPENVPRGRVGGAPAPPSSDQHSRAANRPGYMEYGSSSDEDWKVVEFGGSGVQRFVFRIDISD